MLSNLLITVSRWIPLKLMSEITQPIAEATDYYCHGGHYQIVKDQTVIAPALLGEVHHVMWKEPILPEVFLLSTGEKTFFSVHNHFGNPLLKRWFLW
jgi:phenolic acid decarboxylase